MYFNRICFYTVEMVTTRVKLISFRITLADPVLYVDTGTEHGSAVESKMSQYQLQENGKGERL